jgi:hypothetical protein
LFCARNKYRTIHCTCEVTDTSASVGGKPVRHFPYRSTPAIVPAPMHQHFNQHGSYHAVLMYSNNTHLTLEIQDHYIHCHCPHCPQPSSSSFYVCVFCVVQVYEFYVIGGAVCPSPLAGVEVQLSALVLSEELPVPNRKLVCYRHTHIPH